MVISGRVLYLVVKVLGVLLKGIFSSMAAGGDEMLAVMPEGEDDEFGTMETGPTGAHDYTLSEARPPSPTFRRVLDSSLRAVMGTPGDMEAEIERRTEAEVARRSSSAFY